MELTKKETKLIYTLLLREWANKSCEAVKCERNPFTTPEELEAINADWRQVKELLQKWRCKL